MIIKSMPVKFVEGAVLEKKDGSGLFGFIQVQETIRKQDGDSFTKMEKYFIDNPNEEHANMINSLTIGDDITFEISIK